MKHSKTYRAAADKHDGFQLHILKVAMKLVKEMASAKSDETIEVAVRLGVDPRRVDQMVRNTANPPSGTGKATRVLVFASSERAEAAIMVGVDEIGVGDFVEGISDGYLDFDTAIATPDMMGKVGRLGCIPGPRGLMPSLRTGAVTVDVVKAISDIEGDRIEFHVDRHANLQLIVNKASLTGQQFVENYFATLEEILCLKPAASKGRYVRKVVFSAIMSPSVLVNGTATKPVERITDDERGGHHTVSAPFTVT